LPLGCIETVKGAASYLLSGGVNFGDDGDGLGGDGKPEPGNFGPGSWANASGEKPAMKTAPASHPQNDGVA